MKIEPFVVAEKYFPLPAVILGLIPLDGMIAEGGIRVDHAAIHVPTNRFWTFREMKII